MGIWRGAQSSGNGVGEEELEIRLICHIAYNGGWSSDNGGEGRETLRKVREERKAERKDRKGR